MRPVDADPSATVRIRANGRMCEVPVDTDLASFLEEQGVTGRWVVVEYNGKPLGRDRFTGTLLQEGDSLEIVVPHAGG
jgi:thiamine biosynthesis protein ThiS